MKAITYSQYGRPEVLKQVELSVPTPAPDEVLVRVSAVALNASDWEFLTGSPFYARLWGPFRPKIKVLGSDIAGYVEAVGKDVSRFKPGDAVFGDIMYSWGGFADYVAAPEKLLVHKPDTITDAEAAAIPQAGVVALQGLRDKGRLTAGEHVLINGGGGGAGTFAIQLAKLLGATVTGVDSAAKLDIMRVAGADHVLDYQTDDFAADGEQYDLILDLVAYRSMFDHKRALKKGGRYVIVGGAVPRILQTLILGPFVKRFAGKDMGILAHEQRREDLAHLLELYAAGTVKPMIDRTFSFAKLAEALAYLGDGHAKGKVIITMDNDTKDQS